MDTRKTVNKTVIFKALSECVNEYYKRNDMACEAEAKKDAYAPVFHGEVNGIGMAMDIILQAMGMSRRDFNSTGANTGRDSI